MRFPKKIKRYCPYCKKHTDQKVSLVSSGKKRSSQKRGSISRAKKRGLGIGYGNLGRGGSKPAKFKRKTKTTKKTNLMYTCPVCNKSVMQAQGIRTSKISIEDKKTEIESNKHK